MYINIKKDRYINIIEFKVQIIKYIFNNAFHNVIFKKTNLGTA